MTALQTSNLGDGTQTTLVRIEDVCARSDLVRHLSHCNTGSKIGGWGGSILRCLRRTFRSGGKGAFSEPDLRTIGNTRIWEQWKTNVTLAVLIIIDTCGSDTSECGKGGEAE